MYISGRRSSRRVKLEPKKTDALAGYQPHPIEEIQALFMQIQHFFVETKSPGNQAAIT